jgi:4-amino-4-deoxy-L-arabinose transferase-like glycosyltransferase
VLSTEIRRARLGLALALFAAALLRFWALSQGIGFNPGPDEPEVMERAVRMMKTGDFNPRFFDYPGFYMYVETGVSTLRFLTGAIEGKWAGLAQAPVEDFYLWARAMTALLGTATVWVVYRAGMRWGRQTALLAAVLMAVMPLHVRESHYVLTDVPMTCVVMVTLVLTLRAHERGTLAAFALAGAGAGLAGALKYNGVVAVVMPLLAAAMTRGLRPSRVVAALAVVAAMVAAFLVAAPYTLLDLPTFLNQFARLSSEYHRPPATPEAIWVVYLKHLRLALQWPGSLMVIGGFAVALWNVVRDSDRLRWLLTLVFPVVYFRFVSQQTIVFARYLLPLVPFLSLLAAAWVVATVSWLRRLGLPAYARHAATVALTVLAIVPPAVTSINYDADAAKLWTEGLAYNWIRRELPAGAPVRLEGSLALRLPAAYHPTYVKQLRLDPPGLYAERGIQYLVASSQCYGLYFSDPATYAQERDDYQRLFAETEEVARFAPTPDHPGPELRILKVKRP